MSKKLILNQLKRLRLCVAEGKDRSNTVYNLSKLLDNTSQCLSIYNFNKFEGTCNISRLLLYKEIKRNLEIEGVTLWFDEKTLPKKKFLVDFLYSLNPGHSYLKIKKQKKVVQEAKEYTKSSLENIMQLVDKVIIASQHYQPEDYGEVFLKSTPKFFKRPNLSKVTAKLYGLNNVATQDKIRLALAKCENLYEDIMKEPI